MSSKGQITGNVGLYYCCYRLSKMGWNVMPTARNARGVDIVAYSEDATRLISIQVKALSKRSPVPLGNDLSKCMGHFWIIVTRAGEDEPVTYVMKPREVQMLADKKVKDGRVSFWLQPPSYDARAFKERWNRIGVGSTE